MKVSLLEATKEQLLEYAEKTANIEVEATLDADGIREHLLMLNDQLEEIEIDDPAPAPKAKARKAKGKAKVKAAPEKVKVRISSTETDAHPVFLSVNGNAMYVPRDEDVDIPAAYYEVLKNSTTRKAVQDKEGTVTGWREVSYYNFSVVK